MEGKPLVNLELSKLYFVILYSPQPIPHRCRDAVKVRIELVGDSSSEQKIGGRSLFVCWLLSCRSLVLPRSGLPQMDQAV
jgi:hypothetical protein